MERKKFILEKRLSNELKSETGFEYEIKFLSSFT